VRLFLSHEFVGLAENVTGDSQEIVECLDFWRELDKSVFSEGELFNFFWCEENVFNFTFVMGDLLGLFKVFSPEFRDMGGLILLKDENDEFLVGCFFGNGVGWELC
jgi:hypothetical protein